jgi:hypothetical protein
MHHYASYSVTPRNWHGSPWVRGSTGSSYSEQLFVFDAPGQSAQAQWSIALESDFPNASDANIYFVFFPDGQEPSKNSNNTWNLGSIPPGGAVWWDNRAGVFTQTYTSQVSSSIFPGPGSYRMWVVIDPQNLRSEIDETDNAFPTAVLVVYF